jgi:hypothetical protein
VQRCELQRGLNLFEAYCHGQTVPLVADACR